MNRRTFLFVLIGSVLIVVVAIFFITLQQPDKNQSIGTPKATKKGLTITNAELYANKLDWSVITNIQAAAYRRIVAYSHAGTYSGVIRDKSFQVSYIDYPASDPPVLVPQYQFILDIPAARQSYAVSFSGGKQYPYSILYVRCPEAGQLIYGDFGCVDEQ